MTSTDFSATRIKHLVAMLAEQARDAEVVDDVLQKAGLSLKDIPHKSNAVGPMKEALFVREACDALFDPTFATRAGLKMPETTTITAYITKYSKDLRAAIENSSRYFSLVDPAFSFSLKISGNSASFEADYIDATFSRFHRHKEFFLFNALARMRSITESNFFPLEIRFDHEVKLAAASIRRLAGFPVIFGAERMEIILPLTVLDLPIPTYDPSLVSYLMEYGERLLEEQPNHIPSLRTQVVRVLTSTLPGRVGTADEVASAIGLSRRTFARRLTDEGESFRGIVDDLRCDLAKTYVKGGHSISEIAFILDYSDQASFSTAFKRWTGQSPSEFKSRNSGAGAAIE